MGGGGDMNKLHLARARLVMGMPYMGTLATSVDLVEDVTVDTLSLTKDNRTILYNPVWVEEKEVGLLSSMLGHMLLHIVVHHACLHQRVSLWARIKRWFRRMSR